MSPSLILPPVSAKRIHRHVFGRDVHDQNEEGVGSKNELLRPLVIREDPYHWLCDRTRSNPAVLHYLRQENLYTELKSDEIGLPALQEKFYNSILSHYRQDALSVPSPKDDQYMYYTRNKPGLGYPIHCRVRFSAERKKEGGLLKELEREFDFTPHSGWPCSNEEVLFDVNEMAKGCDSYFFGGYESSPDGGRLAFAEDRKGNEIYTLKFRSLVEGEGQVSDELTNCTDVLHWGPEGGWQASDGVVRVTRGRQQMGSVFYMTLDEAQRAHKVWFHALGTPQCLDICLLEERDEEFTLQLSEAMDGSYIVITSYTSDTSECHLIGLDYLMRKVEEVKEEVSMEQLLGESMSCVRERVEGVLYSVEPSRDFIFMLTNEDKASEMKVMYSNTGETPFSFRDLFSYDGRVTLTRLVAATNWLAIEGRSTEGVPSVWLVQHRHLIGNFVTQEAARPMTLCEAESRSHFVRKPKLNQEKVGVCVVASNLRSSSPVIRLSWSSLVQPWTTIEVDAETGHVSATLHTQAIPNYKSSEFDFKRVQVPLVESGETSGVGEGFFKPERERYVPMSLVWKKKDESERDVVGRKAPTILNAYGSYGYSFDPSFDFRYLPYLDEGFVYAIGHIRGGGDMGRYWYEKEGKLLSKKNTFRDLIACAEYLRNHNIASCVGLTGRSAGGLLVGASVNARPDLFKAAVAGVPFVDVLNTMCDETLPLTSGEWREWGNPHEKKLYEYMLEYSPYDNIRVQAYPHMLFTAGLHDARVGYWEPAKFVAKLRTLKTDSNLLMLKVEVGAGHFSSSDRFKRFREGAFDQAFMYHALTEGNETPEDT